MRQPQHIFSLALLIALSSFGQPVESSKSPPALRSFSKAEGGRVFLPDGTEFKTWEVEPKFTRTYYVDGSNPKASDVNPGTKSRPFASINRAAELLEPGERVVVRAGVYRERVRPARGGTSPTRMISYEAEPGARVILRGSHRWAQPWSVVTIENHGKTQRALQTGLQSRHFKAYDPFSLPNVTGQQFEFMTWAERQRGKIPFTLARGLVFHCGERLTQVAAREELVARDAAYWVDRTNRLLLVRLENDADPRDEIIELTTEETVFAPDEPGLGYIRVKGFTVEHVGGPFPFEQVGAISTTRGHHWIIEDCTVRQVNGVGIDIGGQMPRWPQPVLIGFHIVRRNVVSDCGICGICGVGPGREREFGLLIEDNAILRNAWHDAELLYETGGIKTHRNIRCLIRRNLVADTYHGPGIWMDAGNRSSRCSQNLVLRTHIRHGGIFLELSQSPNLVDNNIVWDTEGNGIYEHDTCCQLFEHNLVGRSTLAAFFLKGKATDRKLGGADLTYGHHEIRNNLMFQNGMTNEFGGGSSSVVGNLSEGFMAALHGSNLDLELRATETLPGRKAIQNVSHDYFGERRIGPNTVPGPFARIPRQPTKFNLWSAPKN